MFFENILYLNNNNEHNLITHMLGAELRNAIQNWRKLNNLPIDFNIPTLNVYFTEPILKTVLIEGICDHSHEHLANICLINKIIFKEVDKKVLETSNHDIYFWSDLGGTIGFSDLLKNNEKKIQADVNLTIKDKTYNKYY